MTLENPATGERIEVVRADAHVLVLDDLWTRPGHRAAEHAHPGMEERVEVLAGCARFRVAGEERDLLPGEVLVIAPGVAHLGWNPTQAEVRLRLELRPPLRWLEVVERLFAVGIPTRGELAALLCEYPEEIAAP